MSHSVAGSPMVAGLGDAGFVVAQQRALCRFADKLCDALIEMRRAEQTLAVPPLSAAMLLECAQSKVVCASLLVRSPEEFADVIVEAVSLLLLASVRVTEAEEGRPC